MKILNLTPHAINVIVGSACTCQVCQSGQGDTAQCEFGNGQRIITIDPEPVPARLIEEYDEAGFVGEIPINVQRLSADPDLSLPEPKQGTLLIVSQVLRNALTHRFDLVSPSEFIRNEKGVIIGCRSLSGNPWVGTWIGSPRKGRHVEPVYDEPTADDLKTPELDAETLAAFGVTD